MADDTVTIRPRRDDDLDELARVLVQVHERDGYPVEGVDDPQAWLRLTHPIGAWVAELSGRPVGHVALTQPSRSDDAPRIWSSHTGDHIDTTAVLGRLFVSPSARGRQIGQRLMRTAMRAAEDNHRVAVLDVMLKDSAAIQMYEAAGWRRLSLLQHRHSDGKSEPAATYAFTTQPNRN